MHHTGPVKQVYVQIVIPSGCVLRESLKRSIPTTKQPFLPVLLFTMKRFLSVASLALVLSLVASATCFAQNKTTNKQPLKYQPAQASNKVVPGKNRSAEQAHALEAADQAPHAPIAAKPKQ